MPMPSLRVTSITTVAVFFLLLGTFVSITVQGAYQVLFLIPLVFYTWRAKGRNFRLPASAWWMLAFAVVLLRLMPQGITGRFFRNAP